MEKLENLTETNETSNTNVNNNSNSNDKNNKPIYHHTSIIIPNNKIYLNFSYKANTFLRLV